MILTNCVRVEYVDCGCNPYFDQYQTGLVSKLSVGNLVSATCTFTQYVIDWYVDGVLVLTTGKNKFLDPDIEEQHPFYNTNALAVTVAGTYVPVLRYFETTAGRFFTTPKPCQKYCDANISYAIEVIQLECGLTGGSPSSGYDYKMQYNSPTGIQTEKDKEVRFYINSGTDYLALNFFALNVYDRIQIYYNEETTALADYYVGTNLTVTSGATDPEQIDAASVKFIVNFSDRTFVSGDYIRIKVTASTEIDTIWYLEAKCLDEGIFDLECDYFSLTLRDVDVTTVATLPAVTYSGATCAYTVSFSMADAISLGYFASNFYKYNSLSFSYNQGGVALSDTGLATVTLTDKHYYYTNAYATNNHGCTPYKRYSYCWNTDLNRFTFIFYDPRDYADYMSYYSSTYNSYKMSYNYTTDPTNPWYYRVFYINFYPTKILYSPNLWDDTGTEVIGCGEKGGIVQFFFHRETIVTGSEDRADIIFTASIRGEGFTYPVVTNVSGDLDAVVVNKRINGVTIIDTSDPDNPVLLAQKQINTITVSGTSGSFTITGTGGITTTVTFRDNLKTTVADFVDDFAATYAALNPGPVTVTCSGVSDYVATMQLDLYTGLRDDFDLNFTHPGDEISRCNNVYSYTNDNVTTIQNSLNAASYSGNTGCTNCVKVNGYYMIESDTAVTSLDISAYHSFYLESLNTVCTSMPGWWEMENWAYRFYIFNLRIEFTYEEEIEDLDVMVPAEFIQIRDHRIQNFRITSGLDRATGEPVTPSVIIYEKRNNVQIIP
jgi:hypothetical protein